MSIEQLKAAVLKNSIERSKAEREFHYGNFNRELAAGNEAAALTHREKAWASEDRLSELNGKLIELEG